MTNIGASGDGAETTTFLAPPLKCAEAFSVAVKQPVDSTTYSAPAEDQGMEEGSRSLNTEIGRPFTTWNIETYLLLCFRGKIGC